MSGNALLYLLSRYIFLCSVVLIQSCATSSDVATQIDERNSKDPECEFASIINNNDNCHWVHLGNIAGSKNPVTDVYVFTKYRNNTNSLKKIYEVSSFLYPLVTNYYLY